MGLREVGIQLRTLSRELSLLSMEGDVGLEVPGRRVVLLMIHINDYKVSLLNKIKGQSY